MIKRLCRCNSKGFAFNDKIFSLTYQGPCKKCKAPSYTIDPNQSYLPGDMDLAMMNGSAEELENVVRSKWVPDRYPISIESKVRGYIDEALVNCNLKGHKREDLCSYGYTYVQVSETDDVRLAGVALNLIQSEVFEKYTSYNVLPVKYSELELLYKEELVDTFWKGINIKAKGTFLKPAKLLRALFPKMSSSEVTCLGSELANILRRNSKMSLDRLVVSDTPSVPYSMASEFDSCMQRQPSSFFEIYDSSPNIKIVYEDDGRNLCRCRALLHEEVHVKGEEGTIKLMDRIYAESSLYKAKLEKWAIKNGYYRKEQQSAGTISIIGPNKEHKEKSMHIKVKPKLRLLNVPYLDTFRFYNNEHGTLQTDSNYPHRSNTTLNNTDGLDSEGVITRGQFTCYQCEDAFDVDDVFYGPGDERMCQGCYEENVSECDYCGIKIWQEDTVDVDYSKYACICKSCYNNHFITCVSCSDSVLLEDCQNTVEGGYICNDCVTPEHTCDECGDLHDYPLTYSEEQKMCLCDVCLNDHEDAEEAIKEEENA